MVKYLQMDGVDDYISLPSVAVNKLEIDVFMDSSNTTQYVYDNRSAGTTYIRVLNAGMTNIASYTIDGVNGTSVSLGARHTYIFNFTNIQSVASVLFARSTLGAGYYVKGNIYTVKLYNGTTLVAHYDMSTGTVQDQSGNGNHATLNGGTWLDDGTGGTPATQDGSANVTGQGLLTASGTVTHFVDGSVTLVGQGLLSSSATLTKGGQSSLIGTGTLSANGEIITGVHTLDGSASLLGTGVLITTGSIVRIPQTINGSASLIGTVVLDASGEVVHVERITNKLDFSFDFQSKQEFDMEFDETLDLTFCIQERLEFQFEM